MWAGLSNCYFWIDQVNGIGGVYVTQILPFGDKKSLPLFCDFQSSVYGLI
jgi:methyl acetate hydrolase